LANQSKTGNFAQPFTPQAPLFLHPAGNPPLPEEQFVHPILPRILNTYSFNQKVVIIKTMDKSGEKK
jgi:hypothetical protein